jgi:hypothetical protein
MLNLLGKGPQGVGMALKRLGLPIERGADIDSGHVPVMMVEDRLDQDFRLALLIEACRHGAAQVVETNVL